MADLHAHYATVDGRGAEAGVTMVADPYVFCHTPRAARPLDGSGYWYPYEVSRRWRLPRDSLGLGQVRLHSLRHFAATELLRASVPLPTVSKRLGHRRTSTMADIYAAFIPASDQEAPRIMGERLSTGAQ